MESTKPPPATAPQLVMLVDDEKPFTDLFTVLLEDGLGLKTIAFNDPASALAALGPGNNGTTTQINPTLVISDLLMPKISGFEFLREFAQRRPGIPSILVTGSHPDEKVVKANQPPDFLGVLHKPISWRTIAAFLRQHALIP